MATSAPFTLALANGEEIHVDSGSYDILDNAVLELHDGDDFSLFSPSAWAFVKHEDRGRRTPEVTEVLTAEDFD